VDKSRILQIVRNFPQNGMRLLLETPANVRDLLQIVGPQFVDLIDFTRMRAERADFIARDFRHVEADLVLRAPARVGREGRRREVLIYVLIEHQSQPDRLMPFRLLDYVTQVYKTQIRDWSREHGTLTTFQFHPVLPLVLYTGDRPWSDVGNLASVMHLGEQFAEVTPRLTPLFVNLPAISDELLRTGGGAFGAVLRLYRDRDAEPDTFRDRLAEVIREIESLPDAERLRWLELLSYLNALVYHVRDKAERPKLHQIVESSVATDEERRSLMQARITGPDEAREEGALLHGRSTLLRQLRLRFGELPEELTSRVKTTNKLTVLNRWLDRVVTANKLDDVGILPKRSRG